MTPDIEMLRETPAWIVWDKLTLSEQTKLTRMWDEAVDARLEGAISLLDKPPSFGLRGFWWDLDRSDTFLSLEQLEILRRTPSGERRRRCLFQMFADGYRPTNP